MKTLLNGQRVFEQQDKHGTLYLLLDTEQIQEYINVVYELAIPKGELLRPNNWVYFTGKNSLIKQNLFQTSDYEALFYPDKPFIKGMQSLIKEWTSCDFQEDWRQVLEIKELPLELEKPLKSLLEKEEMTDGSHKIEAYRHEFQDTEEFLILDVEETDHDIVEEHTETFQDLMVAEEFTREDFSLLRTEPVKNKETKFSNQERWFVSKYNDRFQCNALEEIHDVLDLLKFTDFKKVYSFSE